MRLIIKRISDEVESISADFILYVQTETETSIHAEVCSGEELNHFIRKIKSEYDIKETIYFDL